jgi:hypothetical protein
VEHVLSGDMVAKLETALRARDRLPAPDGPPPSIHPLAPVGERR